MSCYEIPVETLDDEDAPIGPSLSQQSGKDPVKGKKEEEDPVELYKDFVQLTKLRSAPNKRFSWTVTDRLRLPVSTFKMLAGREANYTGRTRFSAADESHVLSKYFPFSGPWSVDQLKKPVYISQFSADGSLFVAGSQGGHIRIYDVDRNWKVRKDIEAKHMRWTITDASLSPDQQFLVYSSVNTIAHIVNVGSGATESVANVTEIHEGLDFSVDGEDEEFGIFSVKFSTDGQELVAAGNDDYIYVYDLLANRCSLQIHAHQSDVNTVCFADETGNIIYSGSDDNLCKVWDRRCFTRGQASGVLIGHLEGITFIDSRRDGRYLISNGKDQSTKLWDIRKMSTNTRDCPRRRFTDWDYRWMEYPEHKRNFKHSNDQSLATYKGHSVLRTLIRCYFSPEYSTGQKYIYTGSSDSCVYIYDVLSGAEVATLKFHGAPVRDCSWHPYYPMMVSSSWDHRIVRWQFPGPAGRAAEVQRAKPGARGRRTRVFYR
ncbi:LEC14B homolog [Pistacia vera]|uniref:LEC14B homolog n=1 Tax=Pistacia vera TaxID=55513 RepID=UPI00126350E3|nr:LEC14B homolog [Pistacia vera]